MEWMGYVPATRTVGSHGAIVSDVDLSSLLQWSNNARQAHFSRTY